MLTVSDLKEACEAIEREHGSDGNVIIQIRDTEGSLINGTYAESMTRDSSGTLYLRGHRKDCVKTGMKQSYSLKDVVEEVAEKIKTIEYDSYSIYVLLVSPDTKEQIGDSIKLPDNVQLRTSPFVEENKTYLLRVGTDIIKPRIGFDRREECPKHDEVFGCADCTAEHCDYY